MGERVFFKGTDPLSRVLLVLLRLLVVFVNLFGGFFECRHVSIRFTPFFQGIPAVSGYLS
jgi:hypothetical protein